MCLSAGMLAVISGPSAVAQSDLGPLTQATAVTPPSDNNASLPLKPNLDGVSCTSPGNCVAVGTYVPTIASDPTATTAGPMAATETGGAWAQATKLTPPSDNLGYPIATLSGVSCTSPGNCTAVGGYVSALSFAPRVMAVTETDGTWAQAIGVTAPSNAASTSVVELHGVSCTSPGNCVAVGNYQDSSLVQKAMEATETDGVWGQATEVTLPSNAGSVAIAGLNGVSCTSAGNCVAVGNYDDNSGYHPMEVTETGGVWRQATAVTLPANVPNNLAFAGFNGVSCTSAGNCVAAGVFTDSASHQRPLVATETDGTWAQATEVAVPSGATSDSPQGFFEGVSCTSPGNCLAVGLENDSGNEYAIEAIETGGTWGPATEVTGPYGLNGVSCTSAGGCVAVGASLTAGPMAVSSLAPTTTTLSSSAEDSYMGQPVTLTATVAPSTGTGTPTGTVTFSQGTTSLGTATVNSAGKATLTTPALPSGSDPVTASYAGSPAYASSTSATLTQTVIGCPTNKTAHLITAKTNVGTTYGLFCVNSTGIGTYQQGSAFGFGLVSIRGNATIVAAVGQHLALLGAATSSSNVFVEGAPLQAHGTFTIG